MVGNLCYYVKSTLSKVPKLLGATGIIIDNHVLDLKSLKIQVDTLGTYFEFIHLEELPQRLHKVKGRPFCLLTFDDGKKQHAVEIAPFLESKGIPAVFYIVTGPMDNGQPLWFDVYEWLVKKLGHVPKGLSKDSMKSLPLKTIWTRIEEACKHYGLKMPDSFNEIELQPMTWDDVRSLDQRGFSIGAHGVNHAILTNESIDDARYEIFHSIKRISEEIGTACTSFAFPNGNYNSKLIQLASEAGAQTIMTTEPIWVTASTSLMRLPRIQLHSSKSSFYIQAKVFAALPGWILKNPDGTGRRYVWS